MRKIFTAGLTFFSAIGLFLCLAFPAMAQFGATTVATGNLPSAIAKDAGGNIYVLQYTTANGGTGQIVKYTNGTGTPTVIYTGIPDYANPDNYATGLVVTSAGDIYCITDNDDPSTAYGQIIKLKFNGGTSYTQSVFQTGTAKLGYYSALAIDAGNNLYTILYSSSADGGNNGHGAYEVVEYPAGSAANATGTVLFQKLDVTGLTNEVTGDISYTAPTGLAVNASGDVYVADAFNNDGANKDGGTIYKLTKASAYAATTVALNPFCSALATDASGNLYASELTSGNPYNYALFEYPNGGGTPVNIYNNLNSDFNLFPFGIAVLNSTNIFVTNGINEDNNDNGAVLQLTAAPPTAQASNITFTNTTNTATTANWTNGNGGARAVFMALANSGTPAPVANTLYAANSAFGTAGTQIGTSGWYCVYKGTGTTVNITGLTGGGTYRTMVVEYNAITGKINYLTSTAANNPVNVTTLPQTTIASINRSASSSYSNLASVQYTVTFGAAITGLTSSDFSLTTTGAITGASISSVSGTGKTYTVTISTGTGNGTIGLNLAGYTGLSAVITTPLPYTGQVYTIQKNAPAIGPSSLPAWTVNRPYNQSLTVTGDPVPVTFAVTTGTLPSGLILNPSTGAITGTPGSTTDSPLSFTVKGTDAAGNSGSQVYTLKINAAVTVTTASLPNWTVNETGYNQTIATTGGTAPLKFSVTLGALPAGLTLGATTGAITGTPTATTGSPFSFTVNVTDAAGSTASKVYTIVIYPAFTITKPSLPNWTLNRPYSQTITLTGAIAPAAFSVVSGTLPAVLKLNASTGAITGTPTTTTGSPFGFTIKATDAVGRSASQQYTITINPALAITTASLPNWTVNQPGYSRMITTNGGTSPLTFSVISGALPKGLSLSTGGGLLSGTPPATGTFNFTIGITDAAGATASQAYTVNILTPTVISSVNRAAASSYSNAASVQYKVTFGAAVTGLSSSNFSLVTTGTITGAGIGSVSGSGTTYTVTVNTGTGNGTIGLNLANNTNLLPEITTPLPFAGQVYTIVKTPPAIAISSPSVSGTSAGPVSYTITYASSYFAKSTLTLANISLNKTGTANGTLGLSGSGTAYTATISGISGTGSLGISIVAGTASDEAGNLSTAAGPSASVTVVNTPTVVATNVTFSNTTYYETTVKWTNGNGAARAVFAELGSAGSALPVQGTNYTASPSFRAGAQIGSSGWYCIYNGIGSAVTLTGVTILRTYRVAVIEYNTLEGSPIYLTNPQYPNNVTIPFIFFSKSLAVQNDSLTSLNHLNDNEKVVANNLLSPNGDGVNDTWLVKNIENYPNNAVTIYDRTGHVVFSKKGYTNDWEGTYHGSVLNQGTYYYLIDLGNGTNLKGFITVVRDR